MGNIGSAPFKKHDFIAFCGNTQQQKYLNEKIFKTFILKSKTIQQNHHKIDGISSLPIEVERSSSAFISLVPSQFLKVNERILSKENEITESSSFQNSIYSENPEVYSLNRDESKKLWDYLNDDNVMGANPLRFKPINFYQNLTTSVLGKSCLIYAKYTSSTQVLLKEDFIDLPEGAVFVADEQYDGKGRGKNIWESPLGCLMFSYKFLQADGTKLPFIQYLVSLAIVKSIHENNEKNISKSLRIKWPNDIYAENNLKVGGIICHSSTSRNGSNLFDVVIGVGLNVFNSTPTTCINSLLKNSNPPITKEQILSQFLNTFEEMYKIFDKEGFEPFLNEYYGYWLHSNQKVSLQDAGDLIPVDIWIKGLTKYGYLLGEDKQGQRYELHPDGNSLDFFKGLIKKKMN